LYAEEHGVAVQADKALIGDGDVVRVAAEAAEHGLETGEGGLDVDYPLLAVESREKAQ
jgi:hypothetical protein